MPYLSLTSDVFFMHKSLAIYNFQRPSDSYCRLNDAGGCGGQQVSTPIA